MISYSVVVPTVGRPSLGKLLDALDTQSGPAPIEMILVDDRPGDVAPLAVPDRLASTGVAVRVVRGGGRGPAAARNTGWRATRAEWVAFLDDDVLPAPDWPARLVADLRGLPDDVGGSQAVIAVPLPAGRRPTDWERNTAGLADAPWITADMAYRRAALEAVGGFDERFPRAYREDADLAVRVRQAGYRLVGGRRTTVHPVRPAGWWASVRAQAGNADDALMRRRHGRGWRAKIGGSPGRLGRHGATTAAGLAGLGGVIGSVGAARRGRQARRMRRLAAGGLLGWAALTAEFAARRIAPGPGSVAEVLRMLSTSVAIPPAACWHRLAGELRVRRGRTPPIQRPAAVLFDRDDTLVHDVAYNADPARVVPIDGVREQLDRLRGLDVPVGVVTNQSGVAKGLISPEQLAMVNAAVEGYLGSFAVWAVCVHAEADGCGCRKPAPGLVRQAAAALNVPVDGCVVIGDTGADVAAAEAAGARGILVPTRRTRPAEIHAAAHVAPDLAAAVSLALEGRRR